MTRERGLLQDHRQGHRHLNDKDDVYEAWFANPDSNKFPPNLPQSRPTQFSSAGLVHLRHWNIQPRRHLRTVPMDSRVDCRSSCPTSIFDGYVAAHDVSSPPTMGST